MGKARLIGGSPKYMMEAEEERSLRLGTQAMDGSVRVRVQLVGSDSRIEGQQFDQNPPIGSNRTHSDWVHFGTKLESGPNGDQIGLGSLWEDKASLQWSPKPVTIGRRTTMTNDEAYDEKP
ncbi:hypothetical protein OPV22_012789 [Ensete ventricosum]|uniref:Uncharacterized protein n=1 Tax=Ensete ventricosum TaxID=4639 RepID=A0AAV8R5X0_ENSVE|nr:hypothetical protein OPV22_012789 [Ensete ventricosum]RWW83075.1 hypothetical protein BHE74_00008432 [Ensete ventricosum]